MCSNVAIAGGFVIGGRNYGVLEDIRLSPANWTLANIFRLWQNSGMVTKTRKANSTASLVFRAAESELMPSAAQWQALATDARRAWQDLREGRCPGADYLGWLDLPEQADSWLPALFDESLRLAEEVDQLVVIGIGGSYLGARALLEAFALPGPAGGLICLDPGSAEPIGLEVHFAGENLGGRQLSDLLRRLRGSRFAVNVISKSGTTLETAAAFRVLRQALRKRWGDEADRHIIATTDPAQGALRAMARTRGWTTFDIPPDVGGRFSVLSPVGLLPLAAAGLNIQALLDGARRARAASLECAADTPLTNNPALHYAALRNHFHRLGIGIEVLASFEPSLSRLGDWWAQLFGESEGKEGRGLFPAGAAYTTDLHSLGQYLQDGRRQLFETFLRVRQAQGDLTLPPSPDSEDGLDALAERPLADLNRAAEEGTMVAHAAGGVPVLEISIAAIEETALGELLFFFQAACALSALMLGVNPFDQPGVEAYKSEMKRNLSRQGEDPNG